MQCGTRLPDDARFCRSCGSPQEPQGAQNDDFYAQPVQQPVYREPQRQVRPSAPRAQAPRQSGALLVDVGRVSSYKGAKAIGTVTGTGDLYIYDDRLEYHKKTGSQSGYMMGPIIGAALMINDAKKNPVDIIPFHEIADVKTGKYAGLMGTLIVELRNGKAISFVPSKKKPGNDPAEMCRLISSYL